MAEAVSSVVDLITSLREAGFTEDQAAQLAGHARPAISFDAELLDEDAIPVGHSKRAGLPDLGRDQSWPIRPAYSDAMERVAFMEQGMEVYSKSDVFDPAYQLPFLEAQDRALIGLIDKPFPLFFVAQINFAEVVAASQEVEDYIPRTGILSLFYDVLQAPWGYSPADRAGFECLWFEGDTSDLRRASQPAALTQFIADDLTRQEAGVTAALAAEQAEAQRGFLSKWLNPGPEYGIIIPQIYPMGAPVERLTARAAITMPSIYAALPELEPELSQLHAEGDKTDILLERWSEVSPLSDGQTQVDGWPFPVQDPDMRLQAQLVTNGIYLGNSDGYATERAQALKAGAQDWVFVAQIDSSDHGWMWGDSGMLYIWIRKQDLAARDFSKAWVILQSY